MSPEVEVVRTVRIGGYTEVYCTDLPGDGGACHEYNVQEILAQADGKDKLLHIRFQKGPILENGVNGVQNEDLLSIVIDRLRGFQGGQFSCRENAIALTKLEEALMWLEKRMAERKSRGVEGKSEK